MSALSRNARLTLLGATLFAATLPLACSTPTRVTSEWKDPSTVPKAMQKVVVVGLRLQPAARHMLEDKLVASLGERGTAAAPSYRVLGETLPDRETVRVMLEKEGYDAAFILSLRRIKETPNYVPGGTSTIWNGPYWGYSSVNDPGYVVTDQTVIFDSILWDLRDGKALWAATTETDNPTSGSDFVKSLTSELLPRLGQQGFIAPRR